VNYGAGDYPYSVFCADLDGDIDLDLVVANAGSDNVSVLKNNGDGTFQPKVDYGAGDGPYFVFCADLDRDTDLDLAVVNGNSDNVSVLKNNGDGTFQTKVDYGVGSAPRSVFCADLDGDTDLDLAVANEESHNVSILKNFTITYLLLLAPLDKDSVSSIADFSWRGVTDPKLNDSVRYNIYLSRSIVFNPDSTVVYDSLPDTTFTDSLDLKLWYWKVKAYDKWGAVRWSEQTWSFYVYLCGDYNGDGQITVADVVYAINCAFRGGPCPIPYEEGDVNCDGKNTVSDVVYTINYLFKGGPKPCQNCP
jgi:DNA-binding beta-propeller fold protein YncE